MTAKLYQLRIKELLGRIFDSNSVKQEWSVRTNASDAFSGRELYAPRLDIAVGPFNASIENKQSDINRIHSAAGHALVNEIIEMGRNQNQGHFQFNNNPRCLLGIEIEYSGSSKHILGDYTNSSMMGLVGVVIGFPINHAKIQRVGAYVKALRKLQKAPSDLFANVVFYSSNEFVELLESFL